MAGQEAGSVTSAGSTGLIAGIICGVVAVIVGMAAVSYLVVRRSTNAKAAAATLEKYKREPVRSPPPPRLTPKPTQLEVA
jgi:hypothetical protein